MFSTYFLYSVRLYCCDLTFAKQEFCTLSLNLQAHYIGGNKSQRVHKNKGKTSIELLPFIKEIESTNFIYYTLWQFHIHLL